MNRIQKHTLKKDDGVANVVVMLLLLSVIVIAFSVVVAVYLPSLKETAELQHSEDVKEAFLRFSSDVDAVYARGQAGSYSQTFELGGGDILFSASKSAGTVEVGTEHLADIAFSNLSVDTIPLDTVTLSYTPVLSYWEDQGYNYSRGVVWVSKNDAGHTPLGSYTVSEGIAEQERMKDQWIESLVYEGHDFDTLTLVDFTTGNAYLSGNGAAVLRITAAYDRDAFAEYTLYPGDSVSIDGEEYLKNDTPYPRTLRVIRLNAEVSVT